MTVSDALSAILEELSEDWRRGEYNRRKVERKLRRISREYHVPLDQLILDVIHKVDDPVLQDYLKEFHKRVLPPPEYVVLVEEELPAELKKKKWKKAEGVRIVGQRTAVSDDELRKAHEQLTQELGRPPSSKELSAALGSRVSPRRASLNMQRLGLSAPLEYDSREEYHKKLSEDIKATYSALVEQLGRPPTKEELEKETKKRLRVRLGSSTMQKSEVIKQTLESLKFYSREEAVYHDVNKDPQEFFRRMRGAHIRSRETNPVIQDAMGRAIRQLAGDLGRIPTADEIAEYIGTDRQAVQRMVKGMKIGKDIPVSVKQFNKLHAKGEEMRKRIKRRLGR